MKILIIFLSLLLSVNLAFGQKKSKVDPKDTKIDSLTKVTQKLSVKCDSVSGELIKYKGLYDAIKEKVLHKDFDPTRSAFLIDSLQASRDSATAYLSKIPKSTTASDSVIVLLKENAALKAEIANNKAVSEKNAADLNDPDVEKAKAISDLKELKDLLDAKIITPAEFTLQKKKYLDKL